MIKTKITDPLGRLVMETTHSPFGQVLSFAAQELLNRKDVQAWLDGEGIMQWPTSHYKDRLVYVGDGEGDLTSAALPEWLYVHFCAICDEYPELRWIHLHDVPAGDENNSPADPGTLNKVKTRIDICVAILTNPCVVGYPPLDGDEVDYITNAINALMQKHYGNDTDIYLDKKVKETQDKLEHFIAGEDNESDPQPGNPSDGSTADEAVSTSGDNGDAETKL